MKYHSLHLPQIFDSLKYIDGQKLNYYYLYLELYMKQKNEKEFIKTINIKTDNNGGITIPISLNRGIYKAVIRFNGMKNYSSCSKSVMINVKPTPVITLNKNTYFYLLCGNIRCYYKITL